MLANINIESKSSYTRGIQQLRNWMKNSQVVVETIKLTSDEMRGKEIEVFFHKNLGSYTMTSLNINGNMPTRAINYNYVDSFTENKIPNIFNAFSKLVATEFETDKFDEYKSTIINYIFDAARFDYFFIYIKKYYNKKYEMLIPNKFYKYSFNSYGHIREYTGKKYYEGLTIDDAERYYTSVNFTGDKPNAQESIRELKRLIE